MPSFYKIVPSKGAGVLYRPEAKWCQDVYRSKTICSTLEPGEVLGKEMFCLQDLFPLVRFRIPPFPIHILMFAHKIKMHIYTVIYLLWKLKPLPSYKMLASEIFFKRANFSKYSCARELERLNCIYNNITK